jgi:hypothetical protein
MKRILFALALVFLADSVASAQSVTNPTKVEYTPSVDHAQLTKYVLGFFLVGATNPVQTVDLPIVAPDGTGKVTQTMPFASLGFGVYVVKLNSVAVVSGVTMESGWSDPSNEGVRAPLATPAPRVVR